MADYIKRKKFDQQITQYENDLKDPQKVQEKRNAAYQSCYTSYIFQMATLPSRAQIAAAEQNSAWAKNRIKEVLGPVLSVQTKQMLNGVIDKSFFSMPRDRESFHQYFMDKLKAETSNAANVASDYRNLISGGQHKPLTLPSRESLSIATYFRPQIAKPNKQITSNDPPNRGEFININNETQTKMKKIIIKSP